MKLILVNRYFQPDESATSQMTSSLAFAMADLGWKVHAVASQHTHNAPHAACPRRQYIAGVVVHRIWTTSLGGRHLGGRTIDYLTFYVGAFWHLLWLSRRGDLLITATDPPLLSVVACILGYLKGVVRINWLQDLFPEAAAVLGISIPSVGNAVLQRLRDHSLKYAALNVVIGDRMAAYLRRRGVPANRLAVIHNWSDGGTIRPREKGPSPLRASWGLTGKFVVGYSGNFGRAHEFATILETANKLRDQADLVFLLIGDGHYRPWVEAQVRALALPNVIIKSFQPARRLRDGLTAPDLHLISLRPQLEDFVVPSKFYGIAAAGRPTIYLGDPDGEVPRLLREGDCGTTISIGDAEGLARRIIQLQHAPAQCERWRHNARRLFMRRFDRRLAIAQWQQLLDRIVRPPAGITVGPAGPAIGAAPRSLEHPFLMAPENAPDGRTNV
jgi:colanic acid biosynthesis glycosyl transferase WcaI